MDSSQGFFARIAGFFVSWIGFGWIAVLFLWLAGTVVILTAVHRFFLERFGTRIPTAVIFAVWTILLMGIGGHFLGYGQPGGK